MIKTKQLALAVGFSAFASTAAFASPGDPVIDFNTSAIPGAVAGNDFSYDDFTIRDNAASQVTQTDTNNDGVLSAGDQFSEFALVAHTGFGFNGLPVIGTGVNNDYTIVTSVTLGGFIASVDPIGGLVRVAFNSGSGSMVYDDTGLGGAAGPTQIATLQNPVSGFCNLDIATETGNCVITFDFEPTIAGLFVSQDAGDLMGILDDSLRVDINIDEVDGLLALLGGYAGYGVTCGAGSPGALCEANLLVSHDGSARHNLVPAPGTLALLGLGLLGLSRRRKQS